MSNQFQQDVNRFLRLTEGRLDQILEGTAREMHKEIVARTPYRTGRARASWNIKANASDDNPAPDIGLGGLDATDAELAAANVFYDSLIGSKSRFDLSPGETEVHITNTVHYVERLNNGSSRQAPAGFFQAIVASANLIAADTISKVAKP